MCPSPQVFASTACSFSHTVVQIIDKYMCVMNLMNFKIPEPKKLKFCG